MEELLKWLAGTGVSGAVLAFYLYKIEPRLATVESSIKAEFDEYKKENNARLTLIEAAITRSSRAELMRICMSANVAPEVKEEAIRMINDANKVLGINDHPDR